MKTKAKTPPKAKTAPEPVAEMRPSKVIVTSFSGRTQVAVNIEDDGAFLINVVRDGRTVHDFSMNYEQPGVDGPPKATAP